MFSLLVSAIPSLAAPVTGDAESQVLALARNHLRDGHANACITVASAEAGKAPSGSEWSGIMAVCLAMAGDTRQAETWLAKAPSSGSYPFAATVRAFSAAQSGNWTQAESEARRALARDPNATAPLLVLGQVHINRSRPDSASACYRKILTQSPRHPGAHTALGGIHFAKKETAPAFEHFATALAERPQDIVARVGLGLIYQSLGVSEEAERAFATALAQDSSHFQAALGLAEIRLFNNDSKGVIAALRRVGKVSSDKRVHLILADAHFRIGNFEDAMANFRSADPVGKDPVVLHGRAMAQLAGKNAAEALASVDAALKASPGSSSYRLARGVVLSQLGRTAEAQGDFAKARALAPVAPLADFASALSFLSEGKVDEAVTVIAKATEALPGFIPTPVDWSRHLTLARKDGALEVQRAFLLVRNQQSSEAIRVMSALAERQKDNLLAHYLLGKALRLKGERTKAVEAFAAAARIEPNFLAAYLELAKLHSDAGEYAKAVTQYQSIQTVDPKGRWIPSMQVETFLGALREKMDDAAGALAHYRRALESSPDNAYLHNKVGWTLGRLKDYESAKLHLEKAVKLEPRALAYLDNLGWVQYLSGDYAHSLKSLQAAEAKGYKDPALSYHLGMAYYRLNHSPQAKRYLTQALALSSHFNGAEEARKILSVL